MAKPLRLVSISLEGLFGAKNYEIVLSGFGTTVLTGSNGSGKSTILSLVKAVSEANLRFIAKSPFRVFELRFSNRTVFKVVRKPESNSMRVAWNGNSAEYPLDIDEADLPAWARRLAAENRHGTPTQLARRTRELVSRYGYSERELRMVMEHGLFDFEPPAWLTEVKERFQVALITDQRLLIVDDDKQTEARREDRRVASRAVEFASEKIRDHIKNADSAYSDQSKLMDRRFPRDVIDEISLDAVASVEEITKVEQRLARTRNRLHRVGLLLDNAEVEPLVPQGSLEDPRVRPVIHTFLRSTEMKLSVLEELARKLTALKDFLDSRFVDKEVEISKQNGVVFHVPYGETVTPSQLSSGEQQMMLLAYEIVFLAEPETLVLVDEPELSLHVAWQDTLIENLTSMGSANGLQFLMATHSATLVVAHRDIERSLDELVSFDA